MARGDIAVSIRGEYDDRDVDRAIRDLKRLGGTADKQTKGMGGLGLKGAAVGTGLAVAGAAALSFGQDAVQAAQESQVADQRLNAVANSMGLTEGAFAGGTERLREYADTLAASIGVEDESIKAVQAKLITFEAVGKTINNTGGAMDRATQAAYDLASAGFGTAEGNATQLGKALQDPVKGLAALARSGVTFTEDQKALIKGFVEAGDSASAQNMILQAVETQVGGTAAATVTAGAKMSVAFGQLQEQVGMAVLPSLQLLVDAILPIFEQIKGPVGEIFGALGTTIAAIVQAIAPLLPPLAAALTVVANVLADVLITAVEALMPVITPLLTLMSDLATRLAPLLGPLLVKVGEALTAVMNAVMPLLPPLLDLVFQILEPLMPILDVVLDVFIQLVNQALAPILQVVGLLLPPLATLINVLLKAILPIIEPLIPIFAGLASILGGAVVGAIGLVMVGFGRMLKGLANAVPFIVNNVIKPIANAFLNWADTILSTADTAFSWVPLIGEKISQARAGMAGLRTTVLAGIDSIAAGAASAGETIAGQLISGGEQAIASAGQLVGQAGASFASAFSGTGGRKPTGTAVGGQGAAMRASGGPVTLGSSYVVGERGPELFIPDVSGTIVPNGGTGIGIAGGAAAGNTYNITVQAGVGDPREIGRQVVEVIKRFERASGPVFAAA